MRALTMPSEAEAGRDARSARSGLEPAPFGPVDATVPVDRADSFRRLAEDHLDEAYALATVILADRGEAEDATHDAVLKAWRAWGSLRSAESFAPWFQRILVNSCRDRLRQRKRRAQVDGPARDLAPNVDLPLRDPDPFARTAERDAIEGALHRLNADEQIVVVFRYFLDLPVEEIAVRLAVPAGTVKSRLHRAIEHLRAAYDAAERTSTEAFR